MELLAALAGSFYLLRNDVSKVSRSFVFFLWVTVFIEIVGAYSPIAYFSDYDYFSFVKDSLIEDNAWLYNCYSVLFYSFLTYFFLANLTNNTWKYYLKFALMVFILSSILNLIFSGIFFKSDALFTIFAGTFLLILSIILFYFELFQSEIILKLTNFLPFYISIGVLVYTLCTVPVDIFSKYFSVQYPMFVDIKTQVYLYTNIFMYGIFALGFLICRRKTSF